MALFSRRKKDDAPAPQAPPSEQAPSGADPDAEAGAAAGAPASVGISLSSFQGMDASAGAPVAPPRATTPALAPAPAEAPPTTETVPGLRDNVLLRDALRALPDAPTPPQIINAVRQLLQGHAFLRVKGDARVLLSDGKDLPLAVATHDGQQYMLVYSSGRALEDSLRADGGTDTSAVGQPVRAVLSHALRGPYAGIILDHASAPSRIVLPREMLRRTFDEADPEGRIKSLLASARTERTAGEVVAAMRDAPLWIAANRASESDRMGIAENRTAEGGRFIEVFSHPLEAVALGRGDQPVRIIASQLAAALAADAALSGALVDPAGPWIRLDRADLAPIIALAPAS